MCKSAAAGSPLCALQQRTVPAVTFETSAEFVRQPEVSGHAGHSGLMGFFGLLIDLLHRIILFKYL